MGLQVRDQRPSIYYITRNVPLQSPPSRLVTLLFFFTDQIHVRSRSPPKKKRDVINGWPLRSCTKSQTLRYQDHKRIIHELMGTTQEYEGSQKRQEKYKSLQNYVDRNPLSARIAVATTDIATSTNRSRWFPVWTTDSRGDRGGFEARMVFSGSGFVASRHRTAHPLVQA